MPASLYLPLYFIVIEILCIIYSVRFMTSPDNRLQEDKSGMLMPVILSLVLIIWLGHRPINGRFFGDTINYAMEYQDLESRAIHISWYSEWVWALFMVTCKNWGISVANFLTLIEAGYVLSVLWAVKKFVPRNPMVGMLFVFSSLMFFSFATNGLRNGLACHIVLLAIAFFLADSYWLAAIFAFIAFGIHRSVMMPILFIVVARYGLKDFRFSVLFWILCIFISLLFGQFILNFITSLGLDDRMNTYNTSAYQESFSSTGFRWDFLIYSVPPIVLGWYALVIKKLKDGWFRCLCATYCYCNAFWILVIRSAFSNRFAYLSWFMYPILLAYPLLNLPIWDKQDKKIGLILLAYSLFSVVMNFIFW